MKFRIIIAALALLCGSALAQVNEGVGFNSIGNPPWPPSDSNHTTAPIGILRVWDSGQKWGQINTAPGTYNWTQMDNLVNNLVQNPGLAVPMAIEYTFGYTPKWAGPCSTQTLDPNPCLPGPPTTCTGTSCFGGGTQCASPSDYSCLPPADMDSGTCTNTNTTGCGLGTDSNFQTFASTLATRYGTKITYYGMPNEADSPNFWCQQGGTVPCGGGNSNTTPNTPALKRLVRLMWDANRITKCANPNRILLTPGFHVGTAATWMHQLVNTSINAPAGSIGGCTWAAQTVTGAQAMEVTFGGPGCVNEHMRGAPNNFGCSAGGNSDPTNVICAYNAGASEIVTDNLSRNFCNDEYGYNGTAQAANVDIQAAYAAINNTLQNSFSNPPIKLNAWYTWDAGQGPLQGTIVGLAWNVVHGWTHNVTSRIGACVITGTVYKCPGTTNGGIPFIIAWDMSQNCNSGCTTGSISFGSSYSKYNDIAGVQHNTTGGTGTVPVGLKPVQVLQTSATLALAVNGGNSQSGTVSTLLSTPLTVLATSNGTPQPGVSITFNDGGAGGSFGTSPATTNGSGIASTTYTLPSSAQTVTINATATSYSPTSFTETAVSAMHVLSISASSGNNQTGNLGTLLPNALTIVATDNGTPQTGVSISFSDGGAGGTFGTPSTTTNGSGVASSTYTLPGSAQVVTVSVSSSGYMPATFTETSAALNVGVSSGNNQIGSVGSTLPTALQAQVTNNGNPVSGAIVNWTDGAAGGSFGAPSGTSNGSGFVTTTYTLPPFPGSVSIIASSAGYSPAAFTETSATEIINAVSGNNQSAPVGTILSLPIVIQATVNGVGNIGVTVTFSDGGAGGSFANPTGVTDVSGNFSTTYTLPSTPQVITLTVTAPGYNPASFMETSYVPIPPTNLQVTPGVRINNGVIN